MFRRCRRPKTLITFIAVSGVAFTLLYLMAGSHKSSALTRTWQELFLDNFMAPGGNGHQTNVHDLEPFSGIIDSDSVGLRGMQKYNCIRALEGFGDGSTKPTTSTVNRLSEQDIIQMTTNCEQFRSKHGYDRYDGSVTREELDFPLAFNILLYKDVDQMHLLLRAIYRPHNSYCLHVDGYADPLVYEATKRIAKCLDNVFLASKRENITYSGFTRLQADINCMQDHLQRSLKRTLNTEKVGVNKTASGLSGPKPAHSQAGSGPLRTDPKFRNESQNRPQLLRTLPTPPRPWRYLINLPSQQFPLKTNLELVKILKIYNGSNDVEGLTGNRMLKNRYTYKHEYRKDNKTGRLAIVRTDKPLGPPPHNITIVKGSAYGVFSREFVKFVLEDKRALDFLEWSKAVSSPDEYYWATLHHDARLKAPGGYYDAPDKKPWLAVYASWPPRDPCYSKKSTRGVCIFGVQDLPQLVARKELFANKFYMDFQPETLHCLDQWIYMKSRVVLPLDTLFYRQLPFVKK